MLPSRIHPHDVTWFRQQLLKLPVALRQRAVSGYDAAWQEAFDAEPQEYQKEAKARFEANTRMRRFVAKAAGQR